MILAINLIKAENKIMIESIYCVVVFGFRQYSLFFRKYHYYPMSMIMKMFNAI
jgi:hypothetical protein